MNKKITLWLAVGLAVLAVVGVGVFSVVNAQTPTPSTTPQPYGYGNRGAMRENMDKSGMLGRGMSPDKTGRMDIFGRFGGLKDSALVVFAEKLGLTVDEVNTRLKAGDTFAVIAESKGITAEKLPAFMQEVCTQVIDQAVKDGKLTQAQADAFKAKLQDSNWTEMWGGRGMGLTPKTSEDWGGRMGSRGGMMGVQDSWMHDELLKAFAAKVGLTVDEVTTRLEAGETHTQIAESKGITGDAYTTLWKTIHTQVIDQAVIDGKLTQEQADAIKARIESNAMPMWGGEFSQGGKGGMMPFGGGRRGK
mgnify:CR=1 FL=1